jgi:ComEC/Rec2-related protein
MRYSLFYPACIGFIAGIFFASLTSISEYIFTLLFFLALFFILYCIVFDLVYTHIRTTIKEYSLGFIILIFIFFASLGATRLYFFNKNISNASAPLNGLIESTISAHGIVVSDRDERETGIKIVAELSTVNETNIRSAKVILTADVYSPIKYGDEINIDGKLERPENFDDDTGRSFDYISYLKKDGVSFVIKNPRIQIIAQHKGSRIVEALYAVKTYFISKLDAAIPFPESRLGAGITVAGKKALPKDVQDDFQKSGTMQVVVLSGYNVTIIAETLAMLLSFLPEIIAAGAGVFGIILFTMMAGAAATIVRGSVMAVLVIVAGLYRRRYSVPRAVMVSAVVMLCLNPMLLVFDPSFQFSFTSVLGLVFFSPLILGRMGWMTERWKLRETAAATTATQIFVLPFILYESGQLSLMALPANMLLFLFLPLTMLLCFIAALAQAFSWILAVPFAWPAFLLLKYELFVTHIFARIPFGFFILSSFPPWLMIACYGCFTVMIWRFQAKTSLISKANANVSTLTNPSKVFVKHL